MANEFVFGGTPSETEQPHADDVAETISAPTTDSLSGLSLPEASAIIPTITPSPQPKSSIMSQLQQVPPKEATVRLTVDLTESMHRKLSMMAARTGRKKAEIVRFLLDEALQEVEE
nr:CopG family transcriptional regulator [Aphanizomenon sp. UHCC 0183]